MPVEDVVIGHDYVTDWNSESGMVNKIINGRVQIWFYAGPTRWFSLVAFKESFSHDKECCVCSVEKT
jgi:hypothetical protein